MAESDQVSEQLSQRKTIVFCDLHRLLVYIRKQQHSNQDMMIRTRSNGMQVRFFISVRRGMVQSLLKLKTKFDLVLYTSLDKEMGDAIVDHIESTIVGGKKLFD